MGDPHYQTFDGKQFDFMGQCSYVMMKTANLTVEAENVACAGSISQAMNLPVSVSGGMPSCTKSLTLKTPTGQVVKLKQGREVVVDGQDIEDLPYFTNDAYIRTGSSIFVVVEMEDGVSIWWDGMTRAYIDVPPSYRGKTKGLCGTFNLNQNDDFLTSEGDTEKNPIPFGNKWKVDPKCPDLLDVRQPHPCDQHIQKKVAAEKHCGAIKSKMFERCHWMVDPEKAYQDCLYDMCSCEVKLGQCLCPIIASYAKECADKGIIVEWRAKVRECGERCPPGQIWQTCGDSCVRTCQDVSSRKRECKKTCAEGCNCPAGQTIGEDGECVPLVQCPCFREGLKFPPGYIEIRPGSKAQMFCKCQNAAWDCREAQAVEVMKYPKTGDLKAVCSSVNNQEFTTCEPVDQPTCKNMHVHQPTSPAICRPGCKCKTGHVLDPETNKCVKPIDCPCHHGGRSYKDGQTVESECSKCKCSGGSWSCEDKICWGECSAWGDSHFTTFDGKPYDYQGQCDYVLSKGSLKSDESFDVTIQNVLCSTIGVTCSKAVTVRVGSETITLTSGRPVPPHATLSRMSLRSSPQMVIVEAADIGLIVRWDRLTRVYVRLDPKWRSHVKGLCGNFNNNQLDDFQTPSGGVSEASPKLFGDSWRLQEYCPEAEQIEIGGACLKRPERKTWANRKCGILKEAPFSACHAEVDVGPWVERCVFDTCACDQGGDCECLCTALAAYVQECNTKGVHVKWRSQELCPMQCDEKCATYEACMSTCPPEDCENTFIVGKLGSLCEHDSCVEGCLPKPCPKGQIRLSGNSSECVPKSSCPKPTCLKIGEVTYYEGDVISEDDCHKCHCSRGSKICNGEPCATTEVYTTVGMKDQVEKCEDGWTIWINQDSAKGKKGRPKEMEPIPTPLLLNTMSGPKCNPDQMIDIQCRTVEGHLDPKMTGLDVECSLEKGLICASAGKGKKQCPDFEIRVLCQCWPGTEAPLVGECHVGEPNKEHPTDCHKFLQCVPDMGEPKWVEKTCGPMTMYNHFKQVCDWPNSVAEDRPECEKLPTTVAPTVPEEVIAVPGFGDCPDGYESSACALECERLCLHYGYIVREKGKCMKGQECDEGCVSAERRTSCPAGMLWRDENTCVQISDCLCYSHKGTPVRPGTVYAESDCELCQCIDNHYVCDRSACEQPTQMPEEVEMIFTDLVTDPTLTPPVECVPDFFIDLIEGDVPLNDAAFSASSVYTPAYAPSAARFSKGVSDKSSGAWTPTEQNKFQYLQVTLPQFEPIYGVILKGSPMYDQYITNYHVLHSKDGLQFDYIAKNNQPELFAGPVDARTPRKQLFDPPIEAKSIRISPQSWHGMIAVQLEIIGCQQLTTTGPSKMIGPTCDDAMGVESQLMNDGQISVSSDRTPEKLSSKLSLASKSSWQPLANSPTEWIQFDFTSPRNLTGVVTKGGPQGWVSAYHVSYSKDKNNWNPLVEDNGKKVIFLGNFDNEKPQVNYFTRTVRAKYLRVEPVKWKDNIQMRVEPLGCFEPYPVEPKKRLRAFISDCNICPDVDGNKTSEQKCTCGKDLWWDGEGCVAQVQCPCVVDHVKYPVGTTFESSDCSNCLCTLFGKQQCKKKKCGKCPAGLRSILTVTCGCICEPCPEEEILCPTSGVCIKKDSWCNGIEDCPDDEVDCPTEEPPTTIEPLIVTVTVPPGKYFTG